MRGELDLLTSSAFGAFLEVAANRHGRLIILDMAGLEFLDASGLNQLAAVLPRMQMDGSELVILSQSPIVSKLLDLTRLAADVHVKPPLSAVRM